MENKKTGDKTQYVLKSVQCHTHFPDDLFTQQFLERAGKWIADGSREWGARSGDWSSLFL